MPLIDVDLKDEDHGLFINVLAAPPDIELKKRFATDPGDVDKNFIRYKALIDTGATGSHVTARVIRELNLQTYGKVRVGTGGGFVYSNRTAASIYLIGDSKNEMKKLHEITMLEMPDLMDGVDIIIGMDILEHCTLHWNGKRRYFQLSFNQEASWDFHRIPPKPPPPPA